MKNLTKWTIAVGGTLVFGAAAFFAGRAFAVGIPATKALTYTGLLQNADDTPFSATGHNLEIRLWNDPASTAVANLLCDTSSQPLVTDSTGHFSQPLSDDCTKGVAENKDTYVEILLDGAVLGGKRTQIGAVPYAVEANHAASADHAVNSDSAATAVSATTAETANAAGGKLASAISTIQIQITTLQAAKPAFQVRNSTSRAAAGSTIVWNMVDIDTSSAYSTATGLYTIPTAGTYHFYFDLLMPNAPGGEFRYGLTQNGSASAVHITIANKLANTWQSLYGSFIMKCAAGDTVGVTFISGSGDTYNDPIYNVFQGNML